MTAALIIAAGKRDSARSFEPGRKVGTITSIQRIVLLLQQCGVREIAVCGEEEEVKKLVPSMNVVFLPCPGEEEMLAHIQRGIGYLRKKADQILVTHVNSPLFSVRTLEALIAADGPICIPSYHGKCGHPVLLREGCFEDILSYGGNQGLRGAMQASTQEKILVPVEDRGILGSSRESEKDRCIQADDDLGRLRLSCKFRIGREAVFYGPGVHQLLHLTQELHSLSEACRYMGISYSKGRKIIQTMEAQMNCTILVTQQGGRGGGYSQLTEPAKQMVFRYDAFLKEADAMLQSLFAEHFGDMQ